jgi:hypothetical protein
VKRDNWYCRNYSICVTFKVKCDSLNFSDELFHAAFLEVPGS